MRTWRILRPKGALFGFFQKIEISLLARNQKGLDPLLSQIRDKLHLEGVPKHWKEFGGLLYHFDFPL